MYHKLPLDEAKTIPCILQHYHKSALTAAHLYNLDPSLSGLQTGHSNQCVKLKYLCTTLITTWMGVDSAHHLVGVSSHGETISRLNFSIMYFNCRSMLSKFDELVTMY